jgi:hypothetical protein
MSLKPLGPSMTLWASLLAGTAILGLMACGRAVPEDDPPVCGSPKRPEVSSLSQCGPTTEFTPINSYQGQFADAVQGSEDAVVLIDGRCTGTLIEASAGPVVLTAGHCVGLGDRSLLVFNFEDAPDGEELITEGTVIERSVEPDYALIKPDVLSSITPVLLTAQASDWLAVIQHPRGRPKVIAEGRFLASCNQLVYYSDLDTLVGSSGAGVLNSQGHLLGIHTDGDCDKEGHGNNRGWTAEAIVEASPYLGSDDLVER